MAQSFVSLQPEASCFIRGDDTVERTGEVHEGVGPMQNLCQGTTFFI